MKKTFLHYQALITLLLVTLFATSCSNDSKLLETIPDDSSVVGLLDAERLCKHLDVKVENGNLVLPPAIKNAMGSVDPKSTEIIAKAGSSIDLKNIAMFYYNNQQYGTFSITDDELFAQSLKDAGVETEQSSGYTAHTLGSSIILTKDGQGWIVDARDVPGAVSQVEKLLKSAADKSINENDDYVKALSEDGIFRAVVSSAFYRQLGVSTTDNADNFTGLAMVADIDDNAIEVEAYAMGVKDDNSKELFKKINTTFLDYTAPNTVFAAAVGINDGQKWEKALQTASALLSSDQAAVINMILPYVKDLDGTLSVTIAADDFNAISAGKFRMALMAECANGNAQGFIGNIDQTMAKMGATGKKEGNMTVYELDPENHLFTGVIAGRACISNYSLTSSGAAKAMKPTFDGKYFAAQLNIPTLSTLTPQAPAYPAELKVTYEDNKCKMRFSLVGDKNPILLTFINAAAK